MSISAEDRLADHAGGVNDPNPDLPERAKRRSYPARYKLEILAEYETLDREGKGALLRREGLYSSLISEWRRQRDKGALEALAAKPGRAPVDPVPNYPTINPATRQKTTGAKRPTPNSAYAFRVCSPTPHRSPAFP